MTEKIDLKNLDKSTWQKVKFSDIAINVRKTSKNPLKDGFTKAIGLGHIEPDNLNLLGYTDIAKEGTKFNKIFRKGQFLFGSRRAYLRQMARATFDGVCTANIMVFDVKDENLINRDLFEFIIRSDSFINCAINTSEGSLFPNAKWKYIAEYEFLLPPKDQQAQLAKLLWAMDDVIEREKEVLNKNNDLRKSQLNETYNSIPNRLKSSRCSLEKIIKLSSGKNRPKDLADSLIDDYKYPVYGGNGIIGYSKDYLIDYNTIVLGRVGEYCGVVHDSIGKVWISDNALYIKEFLMDFNMFYLSRYLEYIDLNKQQNKSSHPLITQSKVCSNSIPLLSEQQIIEQNMKLKNIEKTINDLNDKLSNSQSLQKSLINQVF